MKLKLDENLSEHPKKTLSSMQHDVTTAAEEDLLSQPDVEVAAAARKEGRMLLTLDVEFGNLRKYPAGSHPGIILFRPGRLGPLAVNRLVEEFFRLTDVLRSRPVGINSAQRLGSSSAALKRSATFRIIKGGRTGFSPG